MSSNLILKTLLKENYVDAKTLIKKTLNENTNALIGQVQQQTIAQVINGAAPAIKQTLIESEIQEASKPKIWSNAEICESLEQIASNDEDLLAESVYTSMYTKVGSKALAAWLSEGAFKRLEAKLEKGGKSKAYAGAIAAKVGDERWGKKKMKLAAKEHKPAKDVK